MIDARELRYAVNRWFEGGIITGDQSSRILSFENAFECPRPPSPPTHTSLVALFDDVRAFVRRHPGATVVPTDDPVTRTLGWTAFKIEGDVEHSQLFTIGLTNLRSTLAELAHDDVLRSEIGRPEGRLQIAARLMADATKPT